MGAHPDDEESGLLSYLTRKHSVRAVYWSATRGEGGQNIISPYSGSSLGISRTWESLAAREIGGASEVGAVRTIAIIPAGQTRDLPLEVFSTRLATALSDIGRTTLLNSEVLTSQLARIDDMKSMGERTLIRREGLRTLTDKEATSADDPALDAKITEWLHNVEASHDIVIYQADLGRTSWTIRCLRQADRILLVGRADGDPALGELEKELFAQRASGDDAAAFWREPDLVLLHSTSAKLPSNTASWLSRRPVERHFHFHLTSDAHFARLSRLLTGTQTSLVLSGGGARGAAHVGVLKALEEHGIIIDAIAGVSFGAIMAAGPALGWTADELKEGIWRSLVAPGKPVEFTAPYCSLASGRKATERIRAVFSDVKIEDLWIPYFCISSNITQGEQLIHDRGPLWRAIRASVAIPGILPPLRSPKGDVLIDGAVMNNLPVDLMRKRAGGGTVLAVNLRGAVRLPADDLDDSGILSGWPLLARRLNPFARRPSIPSMLEPILRTAEIGNLVSSQLQESSADLTFNPVVDKYRMLEFSAYEPLIQAGYEEGVSQLKGWRGRNTLRFAR